MANPTLFHRLRAVLPQANARNEAGGPAYALEARHALAQLAATGCFQRTFYADAEAQLADLLALAARVDDHVYLAKLALYARERAAMKDMPAALLCLLAVRDPALLHRVFPRVVDNGRVLRTLVQMVRSGAFGKKSLSASLQRAVQRWLNEASVGALLAASIGDKPSLRDVLRLARPTPRDNERRALFGWLVGKDEAAWAPATRADLPEQVRLLEAYRAAASDAEQAELVERLHARWDLLADAARGPAVWRALARRMGPQALRMNLNTLLRHGALADEETVRLVAERLADADEVRRGRQFPYQYLAAYRSAAPELPQAVRRALHRAAELACGNVPALPGPVVIGLDVSGSMASPVTGCRGRGATTAVRCVDAAALFAAAVLRRNPESVVIPFDTRAYDARLDPEDTILSLAERLAAYGGGGTDCALPLLAAVDRHARRRFAGAVLVSDNQSWVQAGQPFAGVHGATGVMAAWERFVAHQRKLAGRERVQPKLVCLDVQPYGTVQAPEREEILNVGGFSDAVFGIVSGFFEADAARFVREVEAMEL